MFQIRVQAHGNDDDGATTGEEAKANDEEKCTSSGGYVHHGAPVLDSLQQDQLDCEEEEEKQWPDSHFLTGNPQVRVTTGKLRFYRPDQPYVHKMSPLAAVTSSSAATPIVPSIYQQLPHERNTLLCIVTVPSHMSPVELLEFLAGFRDDISSVRVLQDPDRSNCMALLQFANQERADQFFMAHNGTYFNSIEQERCKIVFVRSIEFDSVVDGSGGNGSFSHSEERRENQGEDDELITDLTAAMKSPKATQMMFPPPPPGMTEIPTCAVCLDRLDASASGILTTLCNHTFHCDCLFRWEGSSCPVCRYSHGDIISACEVCHTTEHLWICLICGHVGCGRYSGEHAKQHYQETLHTYSLELETQRVWDYAGDGYVHRLILNKQDGKFVEFPSPSSLSGERSQIPPPTTAEQEEGEHQKLEKLAVEYNFLLKSQLEEQRLFYERRLASANETECRQLVTALENDKKQLKKANETLAHKAHKLEDELTFVRELNKSLIENQKQWKERVRLLEEQKTRMEHDTALRVADLEGQVRDLMFYLDTQSKVANSIHKDDIQGGTVQIESKPRESATGPSATSSSSSTASSSATTRRKTKTKSFANKKAMAPAALRRNTKRVLAALQASNVTQRTRALIRDSPPLRVLGLDINTNSTGFVVLTEHGRLCQWGHVSTAHIQSSDLLGIAHAIDTALDDVHSRVRKETDVKQLSWHVGIEDFMRMYRFGRFHNKGIFQLAQLNGIVSYTCWQRFSAHGVGATPTHTHPSAARAFLGIAASKKKAGAKGDSDIKEQVMAFVQQQEPQLFKDSSTSSSTASLFDKTRNGNFSEAAFDVADAYVIAAFTRWRHFQDQLLLQAPLEDAFADAYMQLTNMNADNKKSGAKPTAEERALLTMSAKEKHAYLRSLYAHGIDEWLKSAHFDFELSNESKP